MLRRDFLRVNGTVAAAAMFAPRMTGRSARAFENSPPVAWRPERFEEAAAILMRATASGQVASATMHVALASQSFTRAFGAVRDNEAMFLLGSISKPIAMTALMRLYDRGEFGLDDPASKFLPRFSGGRRDAVTIRHLLSHVSGLPDQLLDNDALRRSHAPLDAFVERAERIEPAFVPGSRYAYSSMGILLAARIAERITGGEIRRLVEETVFQPLGMKHSAQGLGRFPLESMVASQTERAAPESGGGDPTAKSWDWNSSYWRKLGAPWGGTHASAADVARILRAMMAPPSGFLKPETTRLMIRNHNADGLTRRGLGWAVHPGAGAGGCSADTFGHTGSTGTLAWADPASGAVCVVLTSLPARAVTPHPRDEVSTRVAHALYG
jgi:CubicO group peptidase (beta-lactamase class C family)